MPDSLGDARSLNDEAQQKSNNQATHSAVGAAARKDLQKFGDFIEKEKAEVYLLLDFLSGRPEKKIRDEKISISSPGEGGTGLPIVTEKSLIEAVCQVRWPPGKPDEVCSSQSATILLKARDRLSEIANPASGASIAFTTLTTNTLVSQLGGKHAQKFLETLHLEDFRASKAILENSLAAYPQYLPLAISFNYRKRAVGALLPITLAVVICATSTITYFQAVTADSPDGLSKSQRAILEVLNTNLLPALYGLVGACSGVLRGIQVKIRDGLLMPRDRVTMLMQLWFGIVMGLITGLFIRFTKSDTSSLEALSPSAISFIAGLAVDSVFTKLDDITRSVFGSKSSSSPAA